MIEAFFNAAISFQAIFALINDRVQLIRMIKAGFQSNWPPRRSGKSWNCK
jgi:hypothetical protein